MENCPLYVQQNKTERIDDSKGAKRRPEGSRRETKVNGERGREQIFFLIS